MSMTVSPSFDTSAWESSGKRPREKIDEVPRWKDHMMVFHLEKSCGDDIFFAAGAASRTNKPPGTRRDEDRFDIARLPKHDSDAQNYSLRNNFFAAVYDGHGGSSASEFAKNHLRSIFFKKYLESNDADCIQEILKDTFAELDSLLFEDLQKATVEAAKKKDDDCSCKFFLENPCKCLQARREARTGSTGTVIIVKNRKLTVANIGDSEAKLFSFYQKKQKNFELSRNVIRDLKSSMADNTLSTFPNSNKAVLQTFIELFYHEKKATDSSFHSVTLTECHTPVVSLTSSDYNRISKIASKREAEFKSAGLMYKFGDGIRRGAANRYNYVRLPGTHALNMTRAFGNFGHKTFIRKNERYLLNTEESPVVSTPFVKEYDLDQVDRKDCFFILASDGLWDNVTNHEVYETVINIVKSHVHSEFQSVCSEKRYKDFSMKLLGEVVLNRLASKAANGLIEKAINARKKLDDVTVVVILYNSILSSFL